MNKIQWKLKAGTTWKDKLHAQHSKHGRIVEASSRYQRNGVSSMLISRPLDIDRVVKRVRKGQLITVAQIRQILAAAAGADATCPLTTGIFLHIVAESAEEKLRAGGKRVTPYWRVLESDGKLREQFPGGAKAQAKHLRAEGHSLSPAQGKRKPRILNYEQALVDTHAF